MKYVSKAYLKEKFDNVSWDMNYLMAQAKGNSVPEEAVNNVRYEIRDNMLAILKELDLEI